MLTALVQEKSSTYIHHDQLFKQLLHTFFSEFLETFFPEVHQHVDFSSIKPLTGEVFTDLLEGTSHRADMVIETKLKHEDIVIIIHVEPQSYGDDHFDERMFHYFTLLYNKYRKPILPIAVFSYDYQRVESNQFIMRFPFFKVLSFQFLTIELKKLNWREYIQSNNPVAAALLSKMGYARHERVQVKLEFLRMLVRLELNPGKAELINGFFETYIKFVLTNLRPDFFELVSKVSVKNL